MKPIFRHPQLYTFLFYCTHNKLEKKILDLGAGGNCPPLGIFHDHGYQTCGIEMSDDAIEQSKEFEKTYNMDLNIQKGDMRNLRFEDQSFSFVYSYSTIFHMTKSDIRQALLEMKRVTNDEGLVFVNLLTKNDEAYGEGQEVGRDEFLQNEGTSQVIHSYYSVEEADDLMNELGFEIVYKENRVRYMNYIGLEGNFGFVDYILKKSK